MRIGIIGTAGRGSAGDKLNLQAYMWAYRRVYHLVLREQETPLGGVPPEVVLVSGGAAWMDHVAVSIARWHRVPLELHLPAPWDARAQAYHDTGVRDFRANPGGTANYYHRKFSEKMGSSSLVDLDDALNWSGFRLYPGFFERNIPVGNVDLLIALTFSPTGEPEDGGTEHTWRNSKASRKIHIDLNGFV